MTLALIGIAALTNVSAQDEVPRFEPTDCHFETEKPLEDVDCGELVVWENREDHEEGTLRLAVAIMRSTAGDPEPDPLVYLAGGPGGRSVYHIPRWVEGQFWSRLREKRDLVFYDQRGTGYSDPDFCDELDQILYTTRFLGLEPEEAMARRVEAAQECREKMLAKGIDFSAYNSQSSARDLSDLRRALGYQQWNLFGISYGSRLALTAMREAPSGIRSVILDSTSPPNVRLWVESPGALARSLERVFEQCAADKACRGDYPDLEADFHTWLDRLEQDPVELEMEDTARFPEGRLVVDRSLAVGGVFRGLYNQRFPSILPLLVRGGGQKGGHVWRALAERMVRMPGQNSRGLNLSVECYEVAPFNPKGKLESARREYPRLGVILEQRNRHPECDVWHDERADLSIFEPIRSDLPTFILGGEFDPVTPPDYGRLVAETLPNSTFVEVPAHGHAVSPRTDCTRKLLSRFLDDPGRELDTSCVAELPSLSFVTDVHLSRGVYPVARSIQQGPGIPVFAGAGLIGLVLLSGVVGWPIGALVGRYRGSSTSVVSGLQRSSRSAAALAALLALILAAGLLFAIRDAASINPFLLAFGVSGEFEWIFYLPWVIAVLTIVTVFAAVLAWRQQWWSRGHRIHYSLVAGACVVFLAVTASLGLI
ncbi:alpha/beta fold hydrolase [Wenzhouxiangella sp. EGI_FJ10305]|uniref:alpha/beta fold hydrolase n=1 Tax=Wenzhouxiangella sp. EGI_FJ10305 TaxID=3243768 RepID=UPI0035E2FE98